MLSMLSLHRYWIYSNRLRILFNDAVKELPMPEIAKSPETILIAMETDFGVFMSYWYGSLYVVIEGYKELDLHDPEIDELLESPNVDYLRLFRNGTFHYQSEPFSPKMIPFMDSRDSVPWVQKLHRRLGEFLLNKIKEGMPPELVERTQTMINEIIESSNSDPQT